MMGDGAAGGTWPELRRRLGGWTTPHWPRFRAAGLGWALAWSMALAALTLLPYAYAIASTPPHLRFMGFVYNPDDLNVHVNWIRQASEGAWTFANQFTSEPHQGRFFNLFMLVLGRIGGALDLSPLLMWHIARVLGSVCLGLAIYVALGFFTARRSLRRLGLVVVTVSSGLGWWVVANGLPIDAVDVEPNLVMPEAFTFLSIYLNPLFSFSMALLVLALVLGERALRRGDNAAAVGAGLLGLLLANIHTYDAVPLVAVLSAWTVYLSIQDRRTWQPPGPGRAVLGARLVRLALIVAILAPGVLYQYSLIQSDPLYAAKANTPTPTPSLLTMLVSYGLLVPLAVGGAVVGWRRGHVGTRFWTVWTATHWLVIYLPIGLFPFQRKMIEGLHIAMAGLAAAGLLALARLLAHGIGWSVTRPRWRELGSEPAVLADLACRRQAWTLPLAWLLILPLVPSNLFFVESTLEAIRTNNQLKVGFFMPPFYLPEADVRAMGWMERRLPDDAVVLSLPWTGNYLPARTGRRVFVGHWAESIGFREKAIAAVDFMTQPGAAAEKLAFLREHGITHFYYGSLERQATDGQYPQLPALERVYPPEGVDEGEPVLIFRVRSEAELRADIHREATAAEESAAAEAATAAAAETGADEAPDDDSAAAAAAGEAAASGGE